VRRLHCLSCLQDFASLLPDTPFLNRQPAGRTRDAFNKDYACLFEYFG
jgi:hypothetical protein